ncbi:MULTISPECIES: hypothetical protein [Shewanella]|uniref:hypothetical protein n=1 Tax=Shewanella TaxID=22 RepID=UPI0001DB82C1|nr:hypothetical protein [Shewanella baltica]ADT92961.1 hypothetical protein Sbal678_0777 [Shewanella baltica OS678]
MKSEHGQIQGDIEINSEIEMHGQFTGHVIVGNGGYLILFGQAAQSLTVELGAVVEILGMVVGDVINNGGKVSITGTIIGKVIEHAGETNISPSASIG